MLIAMRTSHNNARGQCRDTSSLNIFIDKTPVPSSNVPFTYLSIGKKPYYSSGLSLNRSIDPTSISL